MLNIAKFPISRLNPTSTPNTPKSLKFAVDKLLSYRHPCLGIRLQSHVGKLEPLLRQFIVPTILITSSPKKLENSATQKTTASSYASPTAPPHPSPPVLMSFIEHNTIHLQDMLKT